MSAVLRPLGEVCKTTSGGTPSRSKPHYFDGTIPWIKSGELPDGIVVKNSEYINEEAISNSSAKLLPAGTLLVALYGATVGKLGILSRPAATNQAVCAIFPSAAVDTKFLFWYLLAKRPWLIGQAAGGAQPNISQGVVRSLSVPVMPLPTQHAIVAEIEKQFSRLDEAVANLQRVKANLKRYKASVLKDAVEGRLVPTEAELARREGRSFETGEQLLQRILEARQQKWDGKGKYKDATPAAETLGLIVPDGWLIASAEQACSSVRDGTHSTPDYVASGVPLITSKNLEEHGLDFENVKFISEQDHIEISKRSDVLLHDILFAMIGTIGNPCEVKTEAKFSIKNVALFKANDEYLQPTYFCYWLQSAPFKKWLEPRLKGTTQKFAPLGLLRELPMLLPPFEEQVRIVAEVDRHLSIIREVEAEVDANLKRAQSLRQATLKQAFEV